MDTWLLMRDRLEPFVAALMERRRVVAPVRRGDDVVYAAIRAPADVVLHYRNTRLSAKATLLPQVECMVRYEKALDHYNQVMEVALDEAPTVLLGARPCDARSLLLLDRVFDQAQYRDPYYLARRANAVVVSLACDHPRNTCFCHWFASGPYDTEGADVRLREAGDAWLVEALTAKGDELLRDAALPAADAAHRAEAEAIEKRAMALLSPAEPVAGIEEVLPALFGDALWREVSEKCLACGTCTYVCPECHCFNIEDRVLPARGERVRAWDACMYAGFTAHASGHNPRPDQASRWRQRTMHKFDYLPHNVGLYGCVGCGRCVQSCPVQLDIRAVLRRVRQAAAIPAAVGGQK